MAADPFALPAFVISIVGLVIASIAAATGIASLVWQITVRTRGAHSIRVEAAGGIRMVSAEGTSPRYVQVTVRNRGAAAVQITHWAIEISGKNALIAFPAQFPPQPTLPHLLEAGTSVRFYVLESELEGHMTENDVRVARPLVQLATGQKVTGRRGQVRFE